MSNNDNSGTINTNVTPEIDLGTDFVGGKPSMKITEKKNKISKLNKKSNKKSNKKLNKNQISYTQKEDETIKKKSASIQQSCK